MQFNYSEVLHESEDDTVRIELSSITKIRKGDANSSFLGKPFEKVIFVYVNEREYTFEFDTREQMILSYEILKDKIKKDFSAEM